MSELTYRVGAVEGVGTVEVVVPVFNEEATLERSITTLCAYLDRHLSTKWCVTIADNASTDSTLQVALRLAESIDHVTVRRLERKGRGRALRAAWLASEAEVVAYMDVDLSTNLESFMPLVAPLLSGHSQVAIGNRLLRGSHTTRQWKRELLSRGYNLLIRVAFNPAFTDAQCGFKAMRRDVAHELLPLVQDTGWFFDTELLLLADRVGMRIFEVPVDWIEDLDSRVRIPSTVTADLRGLARMRMAFWRDDPTRDLRRRLTPAGVGV